MGYFLGYEGNFTFGQIGLSYVGSTAPYVAMRTMMVAFGMLTVGLSFMTLYEMGFSAIASAFSASLLIFGTKNGSLFHFLTRQIWPRASSPGSFSSTVL